MSRWDHLLREGTVARGIGQVSRKVEVGRCVAFWISAMFPGFGCSPLSACSRQKADASWGRRSACADDEINMKRLNDSEEADSAFGCKGKVTALGRGGQVGSEWATQACSRKPYLTPLAPQLTVLGCCLDSADSSRST